MLLRIFDKLHNKMWEFVCMETIYGHKVFGKFTTALGT